MSGEPAAPASGWELGKKSIYVTQLSTASTMGMVIGVGVTELTLGTTLGNPGLDKVEFPNPVRHGDTLRRETRILRKRESTSPPDAGIVWFEHRGYNQRGELVCQCERVGLMKPETRGGTGFLLKRIWFLK